MARDGSPSSRNASRPGTAYGSGANLNWPVKEAKIAPHIPVVDKSKSVW
jgi:hypothetical protein